MADPVTSAKLSSFVDLVTEGFNDSVNTRMIVIVATKDGTLEAKYKVLTNAHEEDVTEMLVTLLRERAENGPDAYGETVQ